MKKTILLSLLLASAVGAVGLIPALAQSRTPEPARGSGRRWAIAQERLGLTDEQIARLKGEFAAEKTALIESAQKVRAARVFLRQTIRQPGATADELRAAAAAVGAAEGDRAIVRSRLHARIAPILTPEQLERISTWQEKLDHRGRAAARGFLDRLAG